MERKRRGEEQGKENSTEAEELLNGRDEETQGMSFKQLNLEFQARRPE